MTETRFRLGQTVRLINAGVEVLVVGLVEPQCGGQVLVDWDGDGAWRFWVEASEVEAV